MFWQGRRWGGLQSTAAWAAGHAEQHDFHPTLSTGASLRCNAKLDTCTLRISKRKHPVNQKHPAVVLWFQYDGRLTKTVNCMVVRHAHGLFTGQQCE